MKAPILAIEALLAELEALADRFACRADEKALRAVIARVKTPRTPVGLRHGSHADVALTFLRERGDEVSSEELRDALGIGPSANLAETMGKLIARGEAERVRRGFYRATAK